MALSDIKKAVTDSTLINRRITSNAEFKRIYWLGRGDAIDHFTRNFAGITNGAYQAEEVLDMVKRSGRGLVDVPVRRDINEINVSSIKNAEDLEEFLSKVFEAGEAIGKERIRELIKGLL